MANFPQQLKDLLSYHHTVLDADLRMVRLPPNGVWGRPQPLLQVYLWEFSASSLLLHLLIEMETGGCCEIVILISPSPIQTFCKALMLLRNKNLINPTSLLELFFQLLRCHDKLLRKVSCGYKSWAWLPVGFDLPNKRNSGQFACSWLWNMWEMGLLLQELAEGKTRSVYHIEACCCTHFYMQQFVSLSCICSRAPWMCLQIKTISTLMSEQKLLNSIWKILS